MGERECRMHKDLDVWQRALVLAESTYRLTRDFPTEERYGLAAQMRRASVSILSNISEGAARRTRAEYIYFLHVARGSCAELDAPFILSMRLGFARDNPTSLESELVRVGQLLNALMVSLSG